MQLFPLRYLPMNAPTIWMSLEITLPVFMIVLVGILLHWRGMVDDAFVAVSSRLVFSVALPVLMFRAIVTADMNLAAHADFVIFACSTAVVAFLMAAVWARLIPVPQASCGAFVQAAFRSNLGIVGLALCVAAYGETGAALGALLLAVVTPLYNLMSVWILGRSQSPDWGAQLLAVLRNPLIVAILAAVPVKWLGLELPQVALQTADYLAQLTLPLALIGVGASLQFRLNGRPDPLLLQTVVLKLVLLPGLVAVAAWYAGFRDAELGVIVLMFASPTAAASFVMARAMKGDSLLTARAIAVTTCGSLLTISGFLYILTRLSLV